MATYLWGDGNLPALGTLSPTGNLDDNSPGDTSSGVLELVIFPYGSPNEYRTVEAYLTGVCDLGALHGITGWEFTCNLTYDSGDFAVGVVPIEFPDPLGAYYEAWIYTSTNGSDWALQATPAVGFGANTESGSVATSARYVAVVLRTFYAQFDQDDTIEASCFLSDFRVTSEELEANELPQCSTRTFDLGDADPSVTGDLWEIFRNGSFVDSGMRYDRRGSMGWGVIYPGLGGVGTITITAPGNAGIGTGYTARVATGGDPATLFDVVAGTCEGATPAPSSNPMYIFSTGRLLAMKRIALPTLTRVTIGAPSAATEPLANLLDSDPTSETDLTRTDGSNRQYLQADLGTAQEVGNVLLLNVTSDGSVAVYVSGTVINDGNFAGATQIPVVGTMTPPLAGLNFRYVPTGAAPSGRYVYIVPTSGTGVTIGELDIRGVSVAFATLQSIGITPTFANAELREACWINPYTVANKQYDGAITIQAGWADFNYLAFELLTGITATGTSEKILTATATAIPPAFVCELEGRTVGGKAIFFTAWETFAPGFTWQAGRNAFSVPTFNAAVYHSDATGPAWRLMFEQ